MAAPLVLQQIFESRKDLGVFLVNESLQNLELGSLSDLHAMCSDAMTCNKLRTFAMHVFFLLRIFKLENLLQDVASMSAFLPRSESEAQVLGDGTGIVVRMNLAQCF